MRTTISLILVTIALLLGNVVAAMSNSNGWISVMAVFSYFLNAVLIAGVVSTCELRSSWLAYIITTSVFMVLVITRSEALSGLMKNVAEVVRDWGMLPPPDSSLKFSPLDRLQVALEVSCPPMFGVAAGCVAILCFPGQRFRKPLTSEYRNIGGVHSLR